jgi:N utilization substance protein A
VSLSFDELIAALEQLQQEKGFSKEVLLEIVEQALAEAYRQRHEPEGEVEVHIDLGTGKLTANLVADGQVSPIDPVKFEAAAATTARKVIFSRLRDAEREHVLRDALLHKGELASATVDRTDGDLVYVNTERSEALLPPEEQIPGEHYQPGQRLKVLLLEPRIGRRGPTQVVSRTHRWLVNRLLEFEVPEIMAGTVVVKALAREAGLRTKLAVESSEEGLDPVGACVGPKGSRIRAVVDELAGERVDVLAWSEDPTTFVANALSPARVTGVTIDTETRTATVMVPPSQLSLAIGKDGQNARLAARLTGWRIDIKPSEDEDGLAEPDGAAAAELSAEPAAEKEEVEVEAGGE